MGLKFIDSILTLLAVVPGVISVYFFGYAISVGDAGWAWITGAILLLIGLGAGFAAVRRARAYARHPAARP